MEGLREGWFLKGETLKITCIEGQKIRKAGRGARCGMEDNTLVNMREEHKGGKRSPPVW